MIYWDIFWLHIVKKMYEATNITRGTGFFSGNWWQLVSETDLMWKGRGNHWSIVDHRLEDVPHCKMRMAPVKAWEFHHSYNHIYLYIYLYIYTYIYIHVILQNQAQSCTILIDLGVLWYVVMRPKRNQNAAPWPPWCVVCFSEKSQEQLYHPEFYKRLSGREGSRPPLKSPMTGAICSGIVLHVSNDKLIMATSRADLTVNEGCEPGFTYGVC